MRLDKVFVIVAPLVSVAAHDPAAKPLYIYATAMPSLHNDSAEPPFSIPVK